MAPNTQIMRSSNVEGFMISRISPLLRIAEPETRVIWVLTTTMADIPYRSAFNTGNKNQLDIRSRNRKITTYLVPEQQSP